MFATTPLSSIVAPGVEGRKNEATANDTAPDPDAGSPSSPPRSLRPAACTSFEESAFVAEKATASQNKSFSIDNTDAYPEMDKGLDPDEGSKIDKNLSKYVHEKEPEGLMASRKMSQYANASGVGSIDDDMNATEGEKKDQQDPPPDKPFPDDEEVPLDKKENNNTTPRDDHVNVVIVDDDDDSFSAHPESKAVVDDDEEIEEKEEDSNEKKEEEERDQDDNTVKEKESIAEKVIKDIEGVAAVIEHGVENVVHDVEEMIKKDKSEDAHVEQAKEATSEPNTEEESPVEPPALSTDEQESANMNGQGGLDASDSDALSNDNGEFLNISQDGEVVKLRTPDRPQPKYLQDLTSVPLPPELTWSSTATESSYFDVHKNAYKETNSKLEEHKDLVAYVSDWQHIVSTRVQSKYNEYSKNRKELNHYAKKVDSLLAEEERLKERGRPMKPKQEEKLGRNKDKLSGAREIHDSSGESLSMLMDEVTLNAWKDAFPLLKRSSLFEMKFAEINHRHAANLGHSLELLNVIGKKESIDINGRIESLEKQEFNPEDSSQMG